MPLFATGVIDTGGKFAGVVDTYEYLHKFSKKFETVLKKMGYSGAGGKLIHEKNQ